MPTWNEILEEIGSKINKAQKDIMTVYDTVRRQYLVKLHEKTGRNIIIYISGWNQQFQVPPQLMSIIHEDIQGLMAVFQGLSGSNLDFIIHSPGGSAEIAEALAHYLRTKFTDIRVFVPNIAASAATILACFGDRIIMGKHSYLGPVDPQIFFQTPTGLQIAPAQDIIDQFEEAKRQCTDNKAAIPWFPLLSQYTPGLLMQCENAQQLSKNLVTQGLATYMFKGDLKAKEKAEEISKKLSDHGYFKSHSRLIDREMARKCGLTIENLENDEDLQDLVLSVFHASTLTMINTGAYKIIENHIGKAFIKLFQPMVSPKPKEVKIIEKPKPPEPPKNP